MADFQGERCETCRYFFVDGENNVCRRLPPTPVLFEAKRIKGQPGQLEGLAHVSVSMFPTMLPSGWCGEWTGQEK